MVNHLKNDGYYLVLYKTKLCKDWIIGNIRGTYKRAIEKAEDWMKLDCVIETKVKEVYNEL